jgi:hypothetical protein
VLALVLLTIVFVSAYADDQSDAVTLIKRLGAESIDDRVAAIKGLERIGGAALPALRAAADASDARVRTRARALIDSIGRQVETDRFARSIMVRLDFGNRPLGEVVDALNDRHDLGLSLRLGPEPRRGTLMVDPGQARRLKELRGRRITLEAAQPLPFWEAIDRLCKVAALRYDAAPRQGFGTNEGFFVLMADRPGRGPVSDSGLVRVQITGVRSMFERDFTRDPDEALRVPKPPGAGDLTVSLAVLPEPGLILHQNGAVMITEAIDDRGRSLVPSSPAKLDPNQPDRAFQVMNGMAAIQVNAVLVAPDPPGTVIRRLRGKVTVIAVTRGSDPIVIPLKQESFVGKPFSTRDMTLVVDEALLVPGAQASVKISIRFNSEAFASGARTDPHRPDFAAFDPDRALEHLELYDAAGRRLKYRLAEQARRLTSQGFHDRLRLIVPPVFDDSPVDGPRTSKTLIPSELRYYGFVQKVMEVPFDFRDIPMP